MTSRLALSQSWCTLMYVHQMEEDSGDAQNHQHTFQFMQPIHWSWTINGLPASEDLPYVSLDAIFMYATVRGVWPYLFFSSRTPWEIEWLKVRWLHSIYVYGDQSSWGLLNQTLCSRTSYALEWSAERDWILPRNNLTPQVLIPQN